MIIELINYEQNGIYLLKFEYKLLNLLTGGEGYIFKIVPMISCDNIKDIYFSNSWYLCLLYPDKIDEIKWWKDVEPY
jgi:hypothetical protein